MTTKITRRVQHAIDDLASEVFLRLAKELGDPAVEDLQGSLCATLVEIEKECRTLAQDATTRRSMKTGGQTPSLVETALQSLTPDQRDALFLHLGRGMTCLEISHQTRIPRGTVVIDLVRAYSRLRLLFGDDNLREIC
jgi:DNA-directed RNA polymerase specialized sigma24 family protein